MTAVRRLLSQRHLATLICAAIMVLRLAVPTGYMIGIEDGRMAITICSGIADQPMAMTMTGAGVMPDHGKGHQDQDHQGKAQSPCPFAGLTAPALGGAGPILLLALVAFVIAAGILPVSRPTLPRWTYVRPPLRGPPIRL